MSKEQERKESFIFFPQEYRLEDNLVRGVDEKGHPWNVTLKVPGLLARDVTSTKEGILPTLERFAETHRKAKNPCFAAEDNSPEDPRGILVFERCELVDGPGRLVKAGWGSVLRADEDEPMPAIGYGFVDMQQAKPDRHAEVAIEELKLAATPEERDALCAHVYENLRLYFSTVLVDYGRARQVAGVAEAESFIRGVMASRTRKGAHGGCLVRVRKDDGVILSSCLQVERGYDFTKKRDNTVDEAWSRFAPIGRGAPARSLQHALSSGIVDCIPYTRIKAGPAGNTRFSKTVRSRGVPKHEKIWVERDFQRDPLKAFDSFPNLVTKLAVRLARTRDGSSMLMGVTLGLGAPIGNVFALDSQYQRAFQVERPERGAPEGDMEHDGYAHAEPGGPGRY